MSLRDHFFEFFEDLTKQWGVDSATGFVAQAMTSCFPLLGLGTAGAAAAVGTISAPICLGAVGLSFVSYLGIKRLHKEPDPDELRELVQLQGRQSEENDRKLCALLKSCSAEADLDVQDLQKRLRKLQRTVDAVRNDNSTKEIKEDLHSLFISLEPFILENFRQLRSEIEERNRDLVKEIESLLEHEPELRLREMALHPSKGQMPLFYGYRYMPLFGRDDEMKRLATFADGAMPFRWWIMTGQGGMGKSRLAFEFCRSARLEFHAGFLFQENRKAEINWNTWQPRRPTFIVIDYAAQDTAHVAGMLRQLAEREKPLGHPVRVLLLERMTDGQWYNELLGTGGDRELLQNTRYRDPSSKTVAMAGVLAGQTSGNEMVQVEGASLGGKNDSPGEMLNLEPLAEEYLRSIFENAWKAKHNQTRLQDWPAILAAFRKIDPLCRPLFATMAADAIADRNDIRKWDMTALLEGVLRKEQQRWRVQCADDDIRKAHEHFMVLATMTLGVSKTERYWQESTLSDVLPKRVVQTIYRTLAGHDNDKFFVPLEPDILGEFFVLDSLGDEQLRGEFLELAWRKDPSSLGFFLGRMASDFPNHLDLEGYLALPRADGDKAMIGWAALVADSVLPLMLSRREDIANSLIESLDKMRTDHSSLSDLSKSASVAIHNRGFFKGKSNDHQGAIADFTTVIEMSDLRPADKALALFNRGIVRGQLNDVQGEIADYTILIEMSDVPTEDKVSALVNRGAAKRKLNGHQDAIDDFTRVIEMPDAPSKQKFDALMKRGVAKGDLNDRQGEITDYTMAIKMADVPSTLKADALIMRGIAKGKLNDRHGEITDYTAAIEMPDLPGEQKASALFIRHDCRGKLKDHHGQVADLTMVIEMPDSSSRQKAAAFVDRGAAKGTLKDTAGAIADFTVVIEMPGASTDLKALALNNRATGKEVLNDREGEIGDYTKVIEMLDAPAEHRGKALINRGVIRGKSNDLRGSIEDFTTLIEMPDATSDQKALALRNRGTVRKELNDRHGAIADYRAVLAMPDVSDKDRSDARKLLDELEGGGTIS
jgi:tetratricopeptide (TPR) repeat protein